MTTWPGSGERPGGDVGVTCRVQDGVAELVLDRPERRNAISEAMFVRLREHVLAFGEDEAVRVVALRSAVPGVFCAGADIATLADPCPDELERQFTLLMTCVDAFRAAPVPIVTIVAGDCLGAGCALAGASDFVIASAAARFALPEVHIGIAPVLAMAALLPVVALRPLVDWSATGRHFTAEEARAAGLVTRVAAESDLDAAVAQWVADIKRTPAPAQRHLKRATGMLVAAQAMAGRDALMREMLATAAEPVARDAVARFLARRK